MYDIKTQPPLSGMLYDKITLFGVEATHVAGSADPPPPQTE